MAVTVTAKTRQFPRACVISAIFAASMVGRSRGRRVADRTVIGNGAYHALPRLDNLQRQRTGNSYAGTAYIFNKKCAPQPYEVSGSVSADSARRTLTSYRNDTLIFTFNGK
jgi:hypothetical protein